MATSAFDEILGNDISNDIQIAKQLPTFSFATQSPAKQEAIDLALSILPCLSEYKPLLADRTIDEETWSAFMNLVWSPEIEDVLAHFICVAGAQMLDIGGAFAAGADSPPTGESATRVLLSLMKQLQAVRLSEDTIQRALARATNDLLGRFVEARYGANRTDQCCVPALQRDVDESFVPFLDALDGACNGVLRRYHAGPGGFSEFWQQSAALKLLRLRPRQLHVILLDRRGHKGEMEDLRWCADQPNSRSIFAEQLERQLKTRHLLAEKSTVEVLELYMEIIAGLKEVDPSGVILTRASPPIMTFLRQRDDAVKIIIASLLEPYEDGKPSTEIFCAPIAFAMKNIAGIFYRDYYEGSDITDPNWVPDPIDAGPDHKKSVSMDELEHLIHLQTKEVFIAQLQQNLAERLLNSSNASFKQEMALLNLLKTRFTEIQIQQCEIMLADVIQSQRLDTDIAKAIALRTSDGGYAPQPEIHTRVLSQHYWPRLKDDYFALPGQLFSATEAYEREFKSLKSNRRLDWLPALGRVSIVLTLGGGKSDTQPHSIAEDVTPLQAAVIQPFDEDWTGFDDNDDPEREPWIPGTCTLAYLKTILDMSDEAQLRQALAFWTHRRVLRESRPGVFSIVEDATESPGRNGTNAAASNAASLSSPGEAATGTASSPSPSPAQAVQADSSLKSDGDLLAENAKVYASFVVGMLTNQGAMPAMRIHMMLRMVVPGGFPFEEAELVAFLQGLAEEGKVERAGAVWRVRKS